MKKIFLLLLLLLCHTCIAADLTISRTILADFGSAEDWPGNDTIANGTGVDDTTNFVFGDQSYKVTTNSNDGCTTRITLGGTLKNEVSVWVFVTAADFAKLNFIFIRFYETYSSASQALFVYAFSTPRQLIVPDMWNRLVMTSNMATEVGTPLWEGVAAGYTFTTIELQIDRITDGADTSVSFGLITTDNASKGGFVWNFDDAKSGVFTYAYPVLKANGWQGVVSIIESQIDQATFLTTAQLQELYDNGWDLICHSKTHPTMSTETIADLVEELVSPQELLIANGWYRGARILAWPGNSAVSAAPSWYGQDQAKPFYDIIRGASTTAQIGNNTLTQLGTTGSAWEPASWQQLPYYALYVNTDDTFAADYEAAFQIIIDKGGLINAYTHNVGPGLTTINMDLPLLNDTAAWLRAQEIAGNVEVVTYGQWREAVAESTLVERQARSGSMYRSRYKGTSFKAVD